MLKILLLFLLIISISANATVGLGTYMAWIGDVQTKPGGDTNIYSDYSFFIGFNHYIPLPRGFYFAPELGIVIPESEGEGSHTRTTIFLLYDFSFLAYTFSSVELFPRFGIGNFIYRIEGKGGEEVLVNGSSTATFNNPSEKINSFNATLNLGLETIINKIIGLRYEMFIFKIIDNNKRNFAHTLSVNYHWKF